MNHFCVQHQTLIRTEIEKERENCTGEYYRYIKAKREEMLSIIEIIDNHIDNFNEDFNELSYEQYHNLNKLRNKLNERILSYDISIAAYKQKRKEAILKFIKNIFTSK